MKRIITTIIQGYFTVDPATNIPSFNPTKGTP